MSLVTRGLGRKSTSGAIATLVSFGIGLTILTVADVTAPGVVQPSASFLLDGPIVSVQDHLKPHELRQNTFVEISVTGSSNLEIHPVITTDFINPDTSKPHTYLISTSVEVPGFTLYNKQEQNNYYDKLIEIEDLAFLLGESLTEIEYSDLQLKSHQIDDSVNITFYGKTLMTGTELQKQLIDEEDEFILFDDLIN